MDMKIILNCFYNIDLTFYQVYYNNIGCLYNKVVIEKNRLYVLLVSKTELNILC